MVSESAAGVDDLLQSAVDGRGADSRRQSVDAADFEATHDCGEDLVLVHDVSFSCWCAVTHLASCLFSFLFTILILEMRLAKVMLLSFDSLYFHRQFLCNVVNRFSSIAVFAGASMLAFLFDEAE